MDDKPDIDRKNFNAAFSKLTNLGLEDIQSDSQVARYIHTIGAERVLELLAQSEEEQDTTIVECDLLVNDKTIELKNSDPYKKAKYDLHILNQGLTEALKATKWSRKLLMKVKEAERRMSQSFEERTGTSAKVAKAVEGLINMKGTTVSMQMGGEKKQIAAHGHVVPREDGIVTRCGGPGICKHCNTEKELLEKGTHPFYE